MKKIQRQIVKFHQKNRDKQVDLQIAQLFQAIDMRNNGKLTRRQIKGILETHGKPANAKTELEAFVPDSDINAIMRRMDNDGDEELSFADYFSSLLPYFIYGELREKPTKNAVVTQKIRSRERSVNKTRKTINLSVSRAKSASAG